MGGEGGEPASEMGCEAAETSRSKQASEKKNVEYRGQILGISKLQFWSILDRQNCMKYKITYLKELKSQLLSILRSSILGIFRLAKFSFRLILKSGYFNFVQF